MKNSFTVRGEKAQLVGELARINDISAATLGRKLVKALIHGTKKIKAADLQSALGLEIIHVFPQSETIIENKTGAGAGTLTDIPPARLEDKPLPQTAA